MNDNGFLKDFARVGIDFNQENLEQVKSLNIKSNEKNIDAEMQYELITHNSEIFLAVIYFFVFTVLLILIKSFKFYQAKKNQVTASKYSNQIPCKLCRFFHDDFYLKCAVNPHIALKAEAINCPDYYPRHDILN